MKKKTKNKQLLYLATNPHLYYLLYVYFTFTFTLTFTLNFKKTLKASKAKFLKKIYRDTPANCKNCKRPSNFTRKAKIPWFSLLLHSLEGTKNLDDLDF